MPMKIEKALFRARIEKKNNIEIEAENMQLKEQIERNRFRVGEMEKELQELKELRKNNRALTDQINNLKIDLEAARAEIQNLKDLVAGKIPKFKKDSCVRWFGGLYEGKKSNDRPGRVCEG